MIDQDQARAELADDIAVTIMAEPDGMGLTYDQVHAIGVVLASKMQPIVRDGHVIGWTPPRPI